MGKETGMCPVVEQIQSGTKQEHNKNMTQCACVRACVCARVCVYAYVRVSVHVCVRACVHIFFYSIFTNNN